MKLYARLLEDGRIAELHTGDPKTDFVSAIADLFEKVPRAPRSTTKRLLRGLKIRTPRS